MKPAVPVEICNAYLDKWGIKDAQWFGFTRGAYLLRGVLADGTPVGLKVVLDLDGVRAHADRVAAFLNCSAGHVMVWALANALYHCELQFRIGKGQNEMQCLCALLQMLAVQAQLKRQI